MHFEECIYLYFSFGGSIGFVVAEYYLTSEFSISLKAKHARLFHLWIYFFLSFSFWRYEIWSSVVRLRFVFEPLVYGFSLISSLVVSAIIRSNYIRCKIVKITMYVVGTEYNTYSEVDNSCYGFYFGCHAFLKALGKILKSRKYRVSTFLDFIGGRGSEAIKAPLCSR